MSPPRVLMIAMNLNANWGKCRDSKRSLIDTATFIVQSGFAVSISAFAGKMNLKRSQHSSYSWTKSFPQRFASVTLRIHLQTERLFCSFRVSRVAFRSEMWLCVRYTTAESHANTTRREEFRGVVSTNPQIFGVCLLRAGGSGKKIVLSLSTNTTTRWSSRRGDKLKATRRKTWLSEPN